MKIQLDDPRLTAYALDEMDEAERTEFERLLEQDPEAREEVEAIRATASLLANEFQQEPMSGLTDLQRQKIAHAAMGRRAGVLVPKFNLGTRMGRLAIAAGILIVAGVTLAVIGPVVKRASDHARQINMKIAEKVQKKAPAANVNAPSPPITISARPQPVTPEISPDVKEHLEALGYVGGEKKATAQAPVPPSTPSIGSTKSTSSTLGTPQPASAPALEATKEKNEKTPQGAMQIASAPAPEAKKAVAEGPAVEESKGAQAVTVIMPPAPAPPVPDLGKPQSTKQDDKVMHGPKASAPTAGRISTWAIPLPPGQPVAPLPVAKTGDVRTTVATRNGVETEDSAPISKPAAVERVPVAAHAESAASSTADEKVPLDIKLPKPMFVGTPKNIKSRNLEAPAGEKRPPFLVPKDVVLISKGRPVTASDKDPVIGELKDITDGNKEGDDGSVVEFSPGLQWVQIDLEGEYQVFAIVAWHFHSQARVYHDVIVQVSDDPDFVKGVSMLYNNDDDNAAKMGVGHDKEYIETSEGRLFDAKGVTGRYVRLYSNGNTSNEMNHMIEVEVYGRPKA